MASITISNLRTAGSELFYDAESYMNEMSEGELNSIHGGTTPFCVGVVVGVIISARFCG